ncbi:MAG: protein kinase [Candidatus Aminicenantes bacterium]|nr:MAG: protein kinase [Candidatus Aminicenantes bacterium]
MGIKCPKCDSVNLDNARFCSNCATPLEPTTNLAVTETIEAPREELTTGSTFAHKYHIIEELGKGGMGRVYKAMDTEVNEKVAIKLLKSEISTDEKTIERFRNELKFARKIRHKNVCQMYDLNKEKDTYYITMEYVSGEDLKSLIRKMGCLGVDKAVSIAKQVCEGLEEAHKLSVVHRDLKPQNIMIDAGGNARIMDFGIARSLSEISITGAGVMIGTPEYMSPEQVEGKEIDQRSDIYSLGVILYEMVTGRVPFEGDTAFTIGIKHKSEIPKDPRELNRQVPEDLCRLILKCLEKDKENRHKNIVDLLDDLNKIESIIAEGGALRKEKPKTTISDESRWRDSIAVLSFSDLSPQKNQKYFCDGMAEELINALTKVKPLKVASKTSAFQFKDKSEDIEEIGKKLRVQSVLDGSVRKAGNRLRITVQLINVDDGYHIWSEKYDREMEDIFAIQDEISLAVVDKLKIKLLEEEKTKLTKRYTENKEAYRLFLKGRYFWNRRLEGDLNRAIEYFNQAIAKDPLYALAYSGIADCLNLIGLWGFLPPKEIYPKAKASAKKALEIDESLGEAHSSLGFIHTFYDWEWQAAESEFKKAIELNPKYATAHSWYSLYLTAMGRFDEAIDEQKKALELDPLSLIINAMMGLIFMLTGRSHDSEDQLQKTIEMDPNFLFAHVFLGQTYTVMEWKGLGKYYTHSVKAFEKAASLSGGMTYVLGHLGMTHSLAGQKDEARKILHQLEKMAKEMFVSSEQFFHIFYGLGEEDKALGYLEKMYEERTSFLTLYNVWAMTENIRKIPTYKTIMKKMDLE